MNPSPWISVSEMLPEHGKRVLVWALKDRLAMEDEADFDKWHVEFGVCCRGRWSVGPDPLGVVSFWAEIPEGPQ